MVPPTVRERLLDSLPVSSFVFCFPTAFLSNRKLFDLLEQMFERRAVEQILDSVFPGILLQIVSSPETFSRLETRLGRQQVEQLGPEGKVQDGDLAVNTRSPSSRGLDGIFGSPRYLSSRPNSSTFDEVSQVVLGD